MVVLSGQLFNMSGCGRERLARPLVPGWGDITRADGSADHSAAVALVAPRLQ
jgi:hypothetical protein